MLYNNYKKLIKHSCLYNVSLTIAYAGAEPASTPFEVISEPAADLELDPSEYDTIFTPV